MAAPAQVPAAVLVAAAPAQAGVAVVVQVRAQAAAQVPAAEAVLAEVRVLVAAVLAEAYLSAFLCWDRCSVLLLWQATSCPARAEKAPGKKRTSLPGRLSVAASAA